MTGELSVPAGSTFEGAGVLVIRDDFDPETDADNRPSTKASLMVDGTFKWTGLVLLAGWHPEVEIRSGADATVVGSFLAEDSVQSQGEISLDSASVEFLVEAPLRFLYSSALFAPGSLVDPLLPRVPSAIVGIREL